MIDANISSGINEEYANYIRRNGESSSGKASGNENVLRAVLEEVLANSDKIVCPEIQCPSCGEDFQLRGNLPPELAEKIRDVLDSTKEKE